MRHLWVLLLLVATPGFAQEACDDVWFTRNLHFDRAGYCFGSPLGQAVFDNSNCIGKDVTLAPDAKRQIDEIRRIEALHGCNVDTNRSFLAIPDLPIPDSDREVIWPLFWKHRGGFFAAHLDCRREPMAWRVEQSIPVQSPK